MADAEFSAGGVVVDRASDPPRCVVIVPTRRAADGSKVVALPKGHPDGDESAADAALREVREETGLQARVVRCLGDVRYVYQRSGRRIAKVVRFYEMEPTGGAFEEHDHEVEVVRWATLEEALAQLTYAGERGMVRQALGE